MKRKPQTQSLLPTEIIKVGDNKINLNFERQTSKLGRPFRWSGVRLCTDEPSIWIDKQLTHKAIYDFKFLDKEGGFISFKVDYYGVFEKVVNE